jgi:hypothetical protein
VFAAVGRFVKRLSGIGYALAVVALCAWGAEVITGSGDAVLGGAALGLVLAIAGRAALHFLLLRPQGGYLPLGSRRFVRGLDLRLRLVRAQLERLPTSGSGWQPERVEEECAQIEAFAAVAAQFGYADAARDVIDRRRTLARGGAAAYAAWERVLCAARAGIAAGELHPRGEGDARQREFRAKLRELALARRCFAPMRLHVRALVLALAGAVVAWGLSGRWWLAPAGLIAGIALGEWPLVEYLTREVRDHERHGGRLPVGAPHAVELLDERLFIARLLLETAPPPGTIAWADAVANSQLVIDDAARRAAAAGCADSAEAVIEFRAPYVAAPAYVRDAWRWVVDDARACVAAGRRDDASAISQP